MPDNPYCSSDRLFRSIVEQHDVFYRSQQRGDAEFTEDEKMEILKDLYSRNPGVFLQRYHQFISPCFVELFDENDYVANHYLKLISARMDAKRGNSEASTKAKNHRYLQLMKLKEDGSYFSNEKMRERDPMLFDVMVGKFLNDEEKLHLRPTVERPPGTWSHMMEQFEEAGTTSRRRKRQLENEWSMPCSSKEAARFMSHARTRIASLDDMEQVEGLDEVDEEALKATYPKHCSKDDVEAIMKKFRKTNVDAEEKKSTWGDLEEDISTSTKIPHLHDEDDIQFGNDIGEQDDDFEAEDADEYPQELMRSELVSIMEQRFLAGDDGEFFDYDKETDPQLDKIRERDLEDAYFDDDV